MDSTTGGGHQLGSKVGAYQTLEAGRTCNVSGACHWTLNVAASNGHGKLYADCYSVSPCGVFVPAELGGADAGRSRRRADLGRLSIRQPLRDHPGARSVSQVRPDQAVVQRRHVVQPHGAFDRRQGAGGVAVQRAVLLRRAARFPQSHRHHVHDGVDDHRHAGAGGRTQVFRARCAARSATSICGPSFTRTTTRRNSRRASTIRWTRGAGGRANGWCSSRIRSRPSINRSRGSSSTAFFRAAKWAAANTKTRFSPKARRQRRCQRGGPSRCLRTWANTVAEHFRRQHAGRGVVARAMIAVEQRDRAHCMRAAMGERVGAPLRVLRGDEGVMRHAPERDDGGERGHFARSSRRGNRGRWRSPAAWACSPAARSAPHW